MVKISIEFVNSMKERKCNCMYRFDNEKFISRVMILALGYLVFLMMFWPISQYLNLLFNGDKNFLLELHIYNFIVVTILIVLAILLNTLYNKIFLNVSEYIFYRWIILVFQISVSFFSCYLWMNTSVIIISSLNRVGIFEEFLGVNFTLTLLLLTFILMTVTSAIVLRFAPNIYSFVCDFNTYNNIYISDKHVTKILSMAFFEKFYGIAVILVTIMWLNNDNVATKNADDYFSEVFNSSAYVLMLSLAIYANYIICLFFKKPN